MVIIAKVAYILYDYKRRKTLKERKARTIEESIEVPNLLDDSDSEEEDSSSYGVPPTSMLTTKTDKTYKYQT